MSGAGTDDTTEGQRAKGGQKIEEKTGNHWFAGNHPRTRVYDIFQRIFITARLAIAVCAWLCVVVSHGDASTHLNPPTSPLHIDFLRVSPGAPAISYRRLVLPEYYLPSQSTFLARFISDTLTTTIRVSWLIAGRAWTLWSSSLDRDGCTLRDR